MNIPVGMINFLRLDNKCTLDMFHPNDPEISGMMGLETGEYVVVRVNRIGAIDNPRRHKRMPMMPNAMIGTH